MATKLFTALDCKDEKQAWDFFLKIFPLNPYFKVGLELYSKAGPAFVEKLVEAGAKIFLDLKFHDIPNTVAAALRQVSQLGIGWTNIHILGGEAMVRASREALAKEKKPPVLLGVTVLTSMDQKALEQIGMNDSVENTVLRLAKLGKSWGLDGIVCSAHELSIIRKQISSDFVTVVPGIRLSGSETGDQARVATPEFAVKNSADFIVVGRPILQAADPVVVVESILTKLKNI